MQEKKEEKEKRKCIICGKPEARLELIRERMEKDIQTGKQEQNIKNVG